MNDICRFAFVFPGQGSQSLGMLGDLMKFELIRKTFDQASSVLGEDLRDLILNGPEDKLNQTFYTQPVMLTSAYAIYQLWRQEGGPEPYAVAGHSLGEYTALLVAGVFDFESAINCVRFRAQVMQNAVPEGQGGMAAIIGLNDSILLDICSEISSCYGTVEAVNFNAPGQTVIAGLKFAVENVCKKAKDAGAKRTLVLPVSAPFHSSLLALASKKLEQYFSTMVFHQPRLRVINNVDAKCVSDVFSIKQALIRQADHPVIWVACIQALVDLLCKPIVECGPGKVLTGLTRKIAPTYLGPSLSNFSGIVELKKMLQTNV